MQRKKLTQKEIEEHKKQQQVRISATRASRRSGKIHKKESKVSKARARAKTPRSQKKSATVRKSRY
jgi:hypothetical protein